MHSVYSMPQCTVHRLVTSLLLWELHYGVQLMEHHRGLWWTAQGGGMIARCFRWGYYIVSGTLFCCSNRVLQMTFYLILQKWTFLAVSAPCVSKPLLVCLFIQTTTFCCTAFLFSTDQSVQNGHKRNNINKRSLCFVRPLGLGHLPCMSGLALGSGPGADWREKSTVRFMTQDSVHDRT